MIIQQDMCKNLLTFIVGTLLIAAPVMTAQDETKRMSETPPMLFSSGDVAGGAYEALRA